MHFLKTLEEPPATCGFYFSNHRVPQNTRDHLSPDAKTLHFRKVPVDRSPTTT
jgi:hypothetical protein